MRISCNYGVSFSDIFSLHYSVNQIFKMEILSDVQSQRDLSPGEDERRNQIAFSRTTSRDRFFVEEISLLHRKKQTSYYSFQAC